MSTDQKSYVLPGEFRRRIVDAAEDGDAGNVASAIADAWERRHPALLKICPGRYYVPASTAVAFYYEEPAAHRTLMMSALGPASSIDYWYRLALAASAAYQVRDWSLLGWLAFQADAALALVRISGDAKPVEADDASGGKPREDRVDPCDVCRAFRTAFDLSTGVLYPANYVSGALAYFYALPKAFAVGPDLIGCSPADEAGSAMNSGESPSPQDADAAAGEGSVYSLSGEGRLAWGMLRMFWMEHHDAWRSFPETIDAIASYPNPFLPLLAEQIRRSTMATAEQAKHPPRVKNPFDRLLGSDGGGERPPSDAIYDVETDHADVVLPPPQYSPLEEDAPPVRATSPARPPALPRRRFARLRALPGWIKRRLPRRLGNLLPWS